MDMELVFEVRDAEEGGYCARAPGHGIFTEAETSLIEVVNSSAEVEISSPTAVRDWVEAAICLIATDISGPNEQVVHGIPSPSRRVREGDILSMDFGVELDGCGCPSRYLDFRCAIFRAAGAVGRDSGCARACRRG